MEEPPNTVCYNKKKGSFNDEHERLYDTTHQTGNVAKIKLLKSKIFSFSMPSV